MVEWMTFISTHVKGPDWKKTEKDFPKIVVMVMANGNIIVYTLSVKIIYI